MPQSFVFIPRGDVIRPFGEAPLATELGKFAEVALPRTTGSWRKWLDIILAT